MKVVKPSPHDRNIKIADRSDLSWATVNYYMADLLTDGPEDEKEIAKSENEAHKELERAQKRVEADEEGATHPDSGHMLTLLQSLVDERGTISLQRPSRPQVLGPCWRCGAYGHIQAHCPMPQGRLYPSLYPLLQPVVSTSAEVVLINEVCLHVLVLVMCV